MQMTPEQVDFQERVNTGSTWTRNEFLNSQGYLLLKNLYDPDRLYSPVPPEQGRYTYFDTRNPDKFVHEPLEVQVEGSTARYSHPQYVNPHNHIRRKLEKELGRRLYNTYYFDRFYFPGQTLNRHIDRDACEISVTIHVSTNLKGKDADWPVWVKTRQGQDVSLILKPGDGMVYLGCERPHWRDPMPTPRRKKRDIIFRRKEKEYYYHQIFFHYVLQDGQRAHCAWDKTR